jgi:phytoene dehydrogenase-like protein
MLDVAIVGAGMSGLTAAYYLQQMGLQVQIFEASRQVGGRIRTDRIDGFQLDRGFHLFHTAYPEAQGLFDLAALKLKPIYQGAIIRTEGHFNLIANPFKEVRDIINTLLADNGTMRDKFRILSLITHLRNATDQELFNMKDQSALDYLRDYGFSEKFIHTFFRPFVHAVFLENKLQTSSRLMLFILKIMSKGEIALPEQGIGAVPQQLATHLKPDTLVLGTRVKRIEEGGLELSTGKCVMAKKILIATNPCDLNQLLPEYNFDGTSGKLCCIYFAAETPPVKKPVILLNGEGKGIVNNVFVPSLAQPAYAPQGIHLVSVTVDPPEGVDDYDLVEMVITELVSWFGVKVNHWEHLKAYHVPYTLPAKARFDLDNYATQLCDRLFVCGDHLSYGSVNAAIRSGKDAAHMIRAELRANKKLVSV